MTTTTTAHVPDDKTIEFRNLLVKAVKTKGEDYVYPRDLLVDDPNFGLICQYSVVNEDGIPVPACIVGAALWPVAHDYIALINARTNLNKVLRNTGFSNESFTPLAEAVRAAQYTQDLFKTWGEALKSFDDKYESMTGYRFV